ncbi:MAG TPA: DUF1918 domain-containing protein [Mycobacteriales bacterium]|nr:DUF1918 domain-containing protein [Mycobacteriales bacterium]
MLTAHKGDRLVVRGRRQGEPDRNAEILEVRGAQDGPPFLVRWSDSGHTGLYFPSSDAFVRHDESAD